MEVGEDFGWDQLTASEYNEFLEAEAYASHIGQFIHKGGKLDRLRAELPTIKTLEFMEIEVGKKTPLKVSIHHTPELLIAIHEELAALHRGYEQKVNYFKSKVKNTVTSENARIQKERGNIQAEVNQQNADLANAYKIAYEQWSADQYKAQHEFEEKRQGRIQDAVSLKINVAERFQDVVNEFLNQLK
jgi:predicted RND superfamily exporter protein